MNIAATLLVSGFLATTAGPYCPNDAGNMAPFCVTGCSAVSRCDKKCRASDAAATCITCEEWGDCAPETGDGDPTDTMANFSGQAVVTRPGCEMTVAARSEHIGGDAFRIFLDKGPCNIIDILELVDTRVASRATAAGSWRIAMEDWGIILITPSSQAVRDGFAAAFPARSTNQRDVTWVNREADVEITFRPR